MDYNPAGSSAHGILQARLLGWVAMLSSGDLSIPGIEPRSPTLQANSLPSEPPGKPMNTGVDSLSLLQGIFLTQEWNQGLLHCRQILNQLSYQGSYTGVSIYSTHCQNQYLEGRIHYLSVTWWGLNQYKVGYFLKRFLSLRKIWGNNTFSNSGIYCSWKKNNSYLLRFTLC